MAEELNFNESYEKITTKTPVHADNLNKIFDLLLENDKFLKYTAESIAEKMLEKGMIANNLVTDNAEMVLAAPMGKELKRQLDEQNNNINSIERFTVTAETTLNDITEWLMNKFQTGLRSVNIYQGEKIVIFNQLGNFNIICTKFIAGDQFTGIAINHWDRNVYSVGIDDSKSIKWEKLTINSDLPIFETFIPTFNNTDTVAITLQHKVIDGGHIFVTNGDFAACPVPIVGIRLPDGDRTNKVEVRFASNIVGVARINILYKPYYS